jgi:hypothetical protein
MCRWMFALLFFSFALWIDAAPVSAQPKANPPVNEWVETADGVKLHAQFTATTTPRKGETAASSPVVLLLYAPGVDQHMNKGNWGGLKAMLNAQGFHVFQFDWRGHGKSTQIIRPSATKFDTGFWDNRYSGEANKKYIKGADAKPVKKTVLVEEIDPKYFPLYIQDLAAVRFRIDQMNDEQKLNASSIYIVGEEEVVQFGFLWLAAEWKRSAFHPVIGGQPFRVVPSAWFQKPPLGGIDIAGAVWLSAKQKQVDSITPAIMETWLKNTPALRDSNPMLFLYGEDDAKAKSSRKYFFDELLVVDGRPPAIKPTDCTFYREMRGTNLRGVGLLGMNDQLKTEDTILAYLSQLALERGKLPAKNRCFVLPYYVDLAAFEVTP